MGNDVTVSGMFITVEQLAERWHTTPASVHQMRHRGRAPLGHKIGKRILFDLADVERFEQSRKDEVPA